MGMKIGDIPQGTGGERKRPEPDEYRAVCLSIIDLGTQEKEWKGEKKKQRRARLTWELVDTREVFNPEKGEQPFVVSKEYTLSFHEKANLRADLKGWRGRDFTAEEMKNWDLDNILAAPCWITIDEYVGKDGTKRVGIGNIGKYRSTEEKLEPQGEVFSFWLNDELDEERFNSFPDWLREKISLSPEYASALRLNKIDAEDEDAF